MRLPAGLVLLVAVAVVLGMVSCGKKTNPIPPEDVPPAKRERLNSSTNGLLPVMGFSGFGR